MSTQKAANVVRLAFTPQEYAKAVGVSIATVRRRLSDGTLPSVLLGRRHLIPAGELRKFAARDAFADFRPRLEAVKDAIRDIETRASAPVDDPRDVAAVRRLRAELDALESTMAAWGPQGGITKPQETA